MTTKSQGIEVLRNISEYVEDTAPDNAADFIATYDVSDATHKKVKLEKLGRLALGSLLGVLDFTNPVTAKDLAIDGFLTGAPTLASGTYRVPVGTAMVAVGVAVRCTTLTATPPTDWQIELYKNGTMVGTLAITLATNPAFAVTQGAWSVVGGQTLSFAAGDVWHLRVSGVTGINAIGAFAVTEWATGSVSGGVVPTGTGFRHITGGVEDAASKLVDTADVNNDQITYAKMQNVSATDRLLGRDTAGAGDPEELTVGGGVEFTGTGGIQRSALTGDVTATAGSGATTIANNAVTTAKIATGAVSAAKIANEVGALAALVGVTDGTYKQIDLSGDSLVDGEYVGWDETGSDWARKIPFGFTRSAAAEVAAARDLTWLVLAANSSDITGVTQTAVMTITGTGAGRFYFKCQLIYQTTATGTGIDVSVNHTGTLTQFLAEHRFSSTGTTATTAAATEAAAGATGATYESQGQRTKNTVIGAGTVSVDAANTDMMSTIEGFFVCSVDGDLQIKMAAESAGLVCRAMQGSFLELKRLS